MTSATSIVATPRKPRVVLYLVPVLLGLSLWAYSAFKYDFTPKRFGVVVPGQIYRSGQLSPRMLKPTLQEHNIRVIVDFQGEKADHDPAMDAEQQVCKDLNIEHHRLPLSGDGTGPIARYADALTTIVAAQRANKPVLIHCSAGTQRTGAATAFYRLLIEKKSPQEAYAELTKYDWNPEKDAILITYINDHLAELAQTLVTRGVVTEVPNPLPRIGP
jgi:protein tyrosine/serine phosphatase